MVDAILNLVFPQTCVLCNSRILQRRWSVACPECWSKLEPIPRPFCPQCGMPAPVIEGPCGACRRGDHAFDLARSVFLFTDPMRGILHHFKYSGRVSLARPLGRQLRSHMEEEGFRGATALPVPLHRARERERGFNQAAVLAKAVSRHSGLRVDEHSLARTTDTPMHRAAMDSKAREATVTKVFEVVRPGLVCGRNILLVDDLLTSGATVSQCARVLKKCGADKVIVLTLARAV